ncbi:MAG: nucleotidyltransferase domain-containing protein [Nanoarchaeota archaeon]|nr:nucleotidyltransferase domain-containing protein [Nanoarchaeota archaeon]
MDREGNVKIVKAFKEILSKKFNIGKLILFGSRARGDFREDSDFDLIVVSDEFEGVRSFKRAPELYSAWDSDNYSVDFICLTSSEFERMKDNRQTVVGLAVGEGVEI